MNRQRLLYLGIAAFLVLAAAFALNARRNAVHDVSDSLLLPALAQNLNAVTGVTLRHGAATPGVTLHKQGTLWTLAERGDYPADVVKLRKLLLALSEARIVEQKTSNPANFAAIGVDDPGQPAATGTQVTLLGVPPPAGLIIGKPAGQGNFVRPDGANTSYLVEPALSVDATAAAWIDTRILDVPTTAIQSVEFRPATGAGYVLRRATADGAFALGAVPNGRKALDAAALAPAPSTLTNLTADDVAPASSVQFNQAPQALITLADGAVLTFTGAASGDKHWLTITSSKDDALNAKFKDRAISVAGYRYDGIFRPLDQLLVPLPPPPGKDASGGKKLPAARSSPITPPAP